jgi:hypothetical protein
MLALLRTHQFMSRQALTALIVIIAIIVLGGVVLAFVRSAPTAPGIPEPTPTNDGNGVVCTMDAMMCPDGSYVGRIPPNCQFAACPASTSTPTTSTATTTFDARINQPSSVRGIAILPQEIVEDSRCPQGVQCIQAGTVRVKTTVTTTAISSSSVIFVLNTPQRLGNNTIELVEVMPVARAGVTITPADYRLKFRLK